MKLNVTYRVFNEQGEEIDGGTANIKNANPIKDREYIRKLEKTLEKHLNKGRVEIFNWKVIGTIAEKMKNR